MDMEEVFLMGMVGVVLARAINIRKVNSLPSHMRNHTSEKVLICTKCDNRKFEIHMQSSIATGISSVCDNSYYQWYHTNKKLSEVLYSMEKPFFCSVCDYRYCKNERNLLYKCLHAGENPISCSECVYRIYQLYRLVQISGILFIFLFIWNVLLHSGEMPFHCTKCDFRYYQKYKVGHIVYTTEYIEGVVCKYSCEIEIKWLYGNPQNKEKPFSWSVCEYIHICKKLFVAVFYENNRNVLNELFHTGKESLQCSGCYYDAQCEFQIVLYINENLFLFFECELFTSERDIEHLNKTWIS